MEAYHGPHTVYAKVKQYEQWILDNAEIADNKASASQSISALMISLLLARFAF